MHDDLRPLLDKLQSSDRKELEQVVRNLAERLPAMPDAEFRAVVEAMCSVFYIDTYDHPELEPALELAVRSLAQQGARVVPLLIELMQGSDVKSHVHLAQALGTIGPIALPALRRFIATCEDPYSRSFALFALGKLRDPAVHEALPEAVGSLMHPDKEVRDSAARALGKMIELIPAELLTERRRTEVFEALYRALDDKQPAVRAKVVRSLGKLALAGYLDAPQEQQLIATLKRLLGQDDHYDWDRAFIVRREAEEALWRATAPRG